MKYWLLKSMAAITLPKAQLIALVTGAVKGDKVSSEKLVEFLYPKLTRYCIYLCRDEMQVSDVVHETLVHGFANISQLKTPEAVVPWFTQIARNLYIRDFRKKKREVLVGGTSSDSEDSGSSQDYDHYQSTMDPPEEVLTVRKVLQELPEKHREILVLIDLEGNSYEETAEIMGISVSAITSRLHRAREAFEKIYQFDERKIGVR